MSVLALALYIGIGVVMVATESMMCVHDGIEPPSIISGFFIALFWPVVLAAILAMLVMVLVIEVGIWIMKGV